MSYCTGILDNTYKILYTLRRVEGVHPVALIHSKYTVQIVLSMLSFTGVDYIIFIGDCSEAEINSALNQLTYIR